MKSVNTDKEKADLINEVSRLYLPKKENRLFKKIWEKGFKNWNEKDIEFLTLIHIVHQYPYFGKVGGLDILPYWEQDEIEREIKVKKEIALQRLTEEPYASWLKNARNYK
jgi:hypothetical protein